MRAGLLPTLPLGSLGTGSHWRFAVMYPGNKPLQRLAEAITGKAALGGEFEDNSDRSPEDARKAELLLVETELRRGPRGLVDLVNQVRGVATSDEHFNVLLLVDQFEEIFTYADAGSKEAQLCPFVDLPDAINRAQFLTPRLDRGQIEAAITGPPRLFGGGIDPLIVPELINSVSNDPDQLPVLQTRPGAHVAFRTAKK